ncbi:MAG: metal-dependent transcriptional regulator [Oscillospiraceae bacterium]|nr:metal-dependent transcriptional regulator [Oscillospiraceae bacterium]
MQLQESGEMYLESIYVLSKKQNCVRSIDISEYMGYSKPSVSRAVSLLKSGGYIQMDGENYITLTDSGLEIAKKIYDRHTLLTAMLVRLGVSQETASQDACRMEHTISDESFEAIRRHMENQK